MRNVKTAILKMGGTLASLALILGVSSLDSACVIWYHQPKIPQSMDKYRKRT